MMTDTILPGIDGDLIDGPVGDDTLFGDYDDEVTIEQIALLKDNVAHLGMDGWTEISEAPPATDPLTIQQREALDAYWSAKTPEAARVANEMMLAAGLPDFHGRYADGRLSAPDTGTVILDGRLWRIVRRVGGATIVDGATRRLIEVEEV